VSELDRTGCPTCGSERLAWHVHRSGNFNQPGARRDLAWACRACGATWTEALDEPAGRPAPSPADGDVRDTSA
jgi:hypothetical protein